MDSTESESIWIRFFDAAGELVEMNASIHKEYHQEIEIHETPVTMRFSSPKNPFIDNTSSEILNRTFLGDLDQRFESNHLLSVTSSNVTPIRSKEIGSHIESDSSGIFPFDPDTIPSAFKNENDLFLIYEFICNAMLSQDKMDIFIDLLLRKKFISKKGGVFMMGI